MKKTTLLTIVTSTAILTGCTTEVGPDGRQRSAMTPMGAAVLQTATAAGIGAGTGAMMRGANPVAVGAVSAGAGSVGSQVINSFIPKSRTGGDAPQVQQSSNQQLFIRSSDGSFVPANVSYIQQPDGSYIPSYPRGRQLFRQLPNGGFAPIN
jgi:hypothetical protein